MGDFFLAQHRLLGQGNVVADLFQRDVVDPEIARGHHSERRPGLLLLLEVRDVGQPRPAECAILVQLHVLVVEHELGRLVPRAGADVQAAEIGGDLVPARCEVERLADADLGPGAAEEQAGVLARMGDLADAELAIALVLPAAPLGEDQPELVPLLGDFEGGIFEQVLCPARAGKTACQQGPSPAGGSRTTGPAGPELCSNNSAHFHPFAISKGLLRSRRVGRVKRVPPFPARTMPLSIVNERGDRKRRRDRSGKH